ncbi:MAG: ATP-binding cassette domain-containing protein [Pseudomonadota bacterium]
MNHPLFSLENIRQEYNGRTVLALGDLKIEPREIIGLCGPNGSGKSTLLRILAFFEDPVAGRVFFRGEHLTSRDGKVRREITLLSQEPYLLKRSVWSNVGYGLKIRGEKGSGEKIRQSLEMVGLDPVKFGRRAWFELSGGEAQRVALAARLVIRPRVLLLDEPTASLDPENAVLIQKAALQAREIWGTTLVVVSHNHAWLESMADRVFMLSHGRMLP